MALVTASGIHPPQPLPIPHRPATRADAQRVFDPELLCPIIGTLKSRVKVTRQEPKLAGLLKDLIAVDGTFFAVAARVAWALHDKSNGPDAPSRKGNFRADIPRLRATPTTEHRLRPHALAHKRVLAPDLTST